MKPKNGSSTPPDFNTLYNGLLAQMGGPIQIETPQLGRVEYPGLPRCIRR